MTTTSLSSKIAVPKPTISRTGSPPGSPQIIGIGTVLWLFGVLSFVAAVLGMGLFWIKHEFLGLVVTAAGVILGCLLLAVVKIIDSLHEIACRLRNIEAKLGE